MGCRSCGAWIGPEHNKYCGRCEWERNPKRLTMSDRYKKLREAYALIRSVKTMWRDTECHITTLAKSHGICVSESMFILSLPMPIKE